MDTNEIGFAYNFGKSDSATTLMGAPWQQRMKDYYEEHGAPDEGNESDQTEPEEEEEEEELSIGVKQATSKAAVEHKVQNRVCQSGSESTLNFELNRYASTGCAHCQRHQRIQIPRHGSSYILCAEHFIGCPDLFSFLTYRN